MIVPGPILQKYTDWQPFLLELAKRVEESLSPYCRENGFVFEGRAKSAASLAEKIESGRFRSWEDLDDLYACTIAAPLSGDEADILNTIGHQFDLVDIKRRGTVPKPPDSFRFDSTRVICTLRPPPGSSILDESIFRLKFEIQVKSLFEYAWAKTTHALTYKSGLVDWKRYRLTAHLKAATEQADFILMGFEQAAQLVIEGSWPDVEDKATLREFFISIAESEKIPPEVQPKDWSRFVDNVYAIIQVLAGSRPSGRSTRRLPQINRAIEILNRYFSTVTPEQFPRSLSLFQITVGVLSSEREFTGRFDHYYLPAWPELLAIFPGARLPGTDFSL